MPRQHDDHSFGGPGPSGMGHLPGPHGSGVEPTWTFAFTTDLTSVTSATVTGDMGSRTLDLADLTFSTTVGTNDLGAEAVVAVTETHSDDRGTHTSVFGDQDGDSVFARILDMNVVTTSDHLRTHSYTFDTDGNVTGETLPARSHGGRHGAGSDTVTFDTIELDGETYIVRTATHGEIQAFEITRDDNADGRWSVIASGFSDTAIVDSVTHTFALDDIALYLASASSIIG